MRESLLQLQSAIRAGNMRALTEACASYAGLIDHYDRSSHSRDEFRTLAAATSGLPRKQITLQRVAVWLRQAGAVDLSDQQTALSKLAVETQKLAQEVTVVFACCRTFSQRLLAVLGREKATMDRYGPLGNRLGVSLPNASAIQGVL
jgi:hypothetical protein